MNAFIDRTLVNAAIVYDVFEEIVVGAIAFVIDESLICGTFVLWCFFGYVALIS